MDEFTEGNGRIYLKRALLKRLRSERCWTQEKLADMCLEQRLSVSLSSIKRAEKGNRVLYRTALCLAKIFDISINDIKIK